MNDSGAMILGVFVHHLFALAKSVVEGCDRVFEQAPVMAKDGYIQVSPSLHAQIDGILIDAANLKKLVAGRATKGSSESTRTFNFRQERAKAFNQLLDGLNLSTIKDTQARNSLEHFDEYLDDLGASLADDEAAPHPAAAYNLVLSSWAIATQFTKSAIFPLRVYVADEKTYFNFQRKVNLAFLRSEAQLIIDRVVASEALKGVKEPGGLMVMFPKQGTNKK